MYQQRVNLKDFLSDTLNYPPLSGAIAPQLLSEILNQIAAKCAEISKLAQVCYLEDIADKVATQNVQGETQMQLDLLTNSILVSALESCQCVAGIVSEELEAPVLFERNHQQQKYIEQKYLVAFDPLDGSSNVSVNGVIGTIFSVLPAPDGVLTEADFLQSGHQQVAAGYVIYGPATMLVLSVGHGTHAFTLSTQDNTFYLTHANIQIPQACTEYAINMSNQRHWELPVQRYIAECQLGKEGPRKKDFNMRWVASMVADIHRLLMRGGIYLYPKDTKQPSKQGRLRLLYEGNPMSMLVEQAGGKSIIGKTRMLEVIPHHIHQRIPVILGSAQEVELLESYLLDESLVVSAELANESPLFKQRSIFNPN